MKQNFKSKVNNFIAIACVIAILSIFALPINASDNQATPFPCGKCLGEKRVKNMYGNYITCPHCLGTGEEPDTGNNSQGNNGNYQLKPTPFPDTSKNCTICKGRKGWYTGSGYNKVWVECNHCLGSGKEPNK